MVFRHLRKRLGTFDKAIISDIALWLTLAFLLAFIAYFLLVEFPTRRGQRITLHFQDASAIIVGSPVRMMGLEIGHVADLKVRWDHVDVILQTDSDAPPIPPGAIFTILFTGLGGSESLEATLPDPLSPPVLLPVPQNSSAPYLVEEPIRLHQVLQSSVDTTRALQQGAENIADFFGKRKSVKALQFNIRQLHDWSDESIDLVSGAESGIHRAEDAIRRDARERFAFAGVLNHRLAHAVEMTSRPHPFSVSLKRISDVTRLCCPVPPRLLHKKAPMLGQSGQSPYSRQRVMLDSAVALSNLLQGAENHLYQAGECFDNAENWLDEHPLKPGMERARTAVQAFNRQVLILDKRFDAKTQATSKASMRSISP